MRVENTKRDGVCGEQPDRYDPELAGSRPVYFVCVCGLFSSDCRCRLPYLALYWFVSARDVEFCFFHACFPSFLFLFFRVSWDGGRVGVFCDLDVLLFFLWWPGGSGGVLVSV